MAAHIVIVCINGATLANVDIWQVNSERDSVLCRHECSIIGTVILLSFPFKYLQTLSCNERCSSWSRNWYTQRIGSMQRRELALTLLVLGKWRGQTRLSADLTNQPPITQSSLEEQKMTHRIQSPPFLTSFCFLQQQVFSSFFRVWIMCAVRLLLALILFLQWCSLCNENNEMRMWNDTIRKGWLTL